MSPFNCTVRAAVGWRMTEVDPGACYSTICLHMRVHVRSFYVHLRVCVCVRVRVCVLLRNYIHIRTHAWHQAGYNGGLLANDVGVAKLHHLHAHRIRFVCAKTPAPHALVHVRGNATASSVDVCS